MFCLRSRRSITKFSVRPNVVAAAAVRGGGGGASRPAGGFRAAPLAIGQGLGASVPPRPAPPPPLGLGIHSALVGPLRLREPCVRRQPLTHPSCRPVVSIRTWPLHREGLQALQQHLGAPLPRSDPIEVGGVAATRWRPLKKASRRFPPILEISKKKCTKCRRL